MWLNLANTHGHQDGVRKIPRVDEIEKEKAWELIIVGK